MPTSTRSQKKRKQTNANTALQTTHDEDASICERCESSPCDWSIYGERLKDMSGNLYKRMIWKGEEIIVDENEVEVENDQMRRCLYNGYVFMKKGHFGHGRCTVVPMCVANEIRQMYPEQNGQYPDILLPS